MAVVASWLSYELHAFKKGWNFDYPVIATSLRLLTFLYIVDLALRGHIKCAAYLKHVAVTIQRCVLQTKNNKIAAPFEFS